MKSIETTETDAGTATDDLVSAVTTACVRITHTPIFRGANGKSHTNGPTGFTCGTTEITSDVPLLDLMVAADEDAERHDFNFRNASSC